MRPIKVWLNFLCLPLIPLGKAYSTVGEDSFLANYVTRPDIRSPVFNLTVYNDTLISQGHWFVAPYYDFQAREPSPLWSPGQIGPHIYDSDGQLVWSGAHLFPGRPGFDFRPFRVDDGEQKLSFILASNENEKQLESGAGVVIDSTLSVIRTLEIPQVGTGTWDMHEFRVLPSGKTALAFVMVPKHLPTSQTLKGQQESIWNEGFVEFNVETGEIVFQWMAFAHTNEDEHQLASIKTSSEWEAFHFNSIDKDRWGNYLLSSRNKNTIYNISGTTGSINWRLGGIASSFQLDNFTFAGQHDARVLEQNSTTTIISVLNNAARLGYAIETEHTSALVLALRTDSKPATATVIHEWRRPDNEFSKIRGNVQLLDDGNVFVGWSSNSYISEFSPDGRLLFEARFLSPKLTSYRVYKFKFTSTPVEPPVLRAFVSGTRLEASLTTVYVSWNGATEIAAWRFFGVAGQALEKGFLEKEKGTEKFQFIGEKPKTGFETTLVTDGSYNEVYAVAISRNGSIIGRSNLEYPSIPRHWSTPTPADENSRSSSSPGKYMESSSASDCQHPLSQTLAPSAGVHNTRSQHHFYALVVLQFGVILWLVSQKEARSRKLGL